MAAPESSRERSEQAVTYKFANIDVASLTYSGGQVLHTVRTPTMLSMGLLIMPDMTVALVRPKITLPTTDGILRPRKFPNIETAVGVASRMAELWGRSYSDQGIPCVLLNFATYRPGGRWPSFLNEDGRKFDEEDYLMRAKLYRSMTLAATATPVLEIYRDIIESGDNERVTKITSLVDFEAGIN